MEIVETVDAVDENNPWFRHLIGRAHHAFPKIDGFNGLVGIVAKNQIPIEILFHSRHKRVGDQNRQIKHVEPARLLLSRYKVFDVRMIAAHRPHHGASAMARAHYGAAHRIPNIHEGKRPRRIGPDAFYRRALWPKA